MPIDDLRAQLQHEIAVALEGRLKEGTKIPLTERGMAVIEEVVKVTIRTFMQTHNIVELFDTGITIEQLRAANDWAMLARVPAGTPEWFTLWCSEWRVKAEAVPAGDPRGPRALNLRIDPAGTIEFRSPWLY